MLAAVDRLLRRERLDFLGQPSRSAIAELAHALDEERLAGRKRRRQRIVDCSRFDAPAVPKSQLRGAAAEAAVARGDAEVRWGWQNRRGHEARVD